MNNWNPEPEVNESALFETQDLDLLRTLLLGHYRDKLAEIEANLAALEMNTTDQDALIDTLTPVLGELIRNNIRNNREEMIETLYPIIGSLVVRAVTEAIQDLARNVDERMRRSFDIHFLWRQVKAQFGGVSQAEAVLRSALPFEVSEIFLIHLESGLPIWYESSRTDELPDDSDLIGSMLTAIRDFVADSFGQGLTGDLARIEYGDRQILIESTRHIYTAVVFHGIEPSGYRETLRRCLIEIEFKHGRQLRRYDGDPGPFKGTAQEQFHPLLAVTTPEPKEELTPDRAEKVWLFVGIVAVEVMLLIALWIWYMGR
ncbi:MAG: hypothetical protein KF893_21475 [Caldilineaceae bacterium]|nr:hypothetical protein [Caldilineaceae bacterium]